MGVSSSCVFCFGFKSGVAVSTDGAKQRRTSVEDGQPQPRTVKPIPSACENHHGQQIRAARAHGRHLLGLPAAVWGWLTGLPMLTFGLAIWGEASCMLIEHRAAEAASRSGCKIDAAAVRPKTARWTNSSQSWCFLGLASKNGERR